MGLFKRKPKKIEVKEFDYAATKEYFEANRSLDPKNFLKCPEWMKPEFDENGNYAEEPDNMLPLYNLRTQQRFYKEGKLAIGALVQANEMIFKPGDIDVGGAMLYTFEPYYIEHPDELRGLAHELFNTKGDTGYAPSIQRLADALADEVERVCRYKIPRNVTENRDVYYTTVMFSREHLPNGFLPGGITFPMLILEDIEPEAIVLPKWYWK